MKLRKTITKSFAMLLAILMLVSLAACGTADPAPAQDDPPAAADTEPPAAADPGADTAADTDVPAGPVELTIAMPLHADDTATMDGKIMQKLMADTNTNLVFDWWPADGVAERRNTMLADINNLPDMFHITAEQATIYGSEGILEPLDDLIAQYAPNIAALLTEENSVPLRNPADGKIYYLPKYNTINQINESTFTYRKDILDAMGEEEPNTIDEWYELFVKVKEQYPDMIVLTERNANVAFNSHPAFDMGRFMIGDFLFGMLPSEIDQRQSVFLPTSQQWKDMLMFYNKLYNEGILDPAYLTHNDDTWWFEKVAGGQAFACWTMNQGRAQQATDLAHEAGLTDVEWRVAQLTENYNTGVRELYKVANPWEIDGFALNANMSEEEKIAAIKFLDYNFSPEGTLLFYYGIEGEDYNLVDGEPVRTTDFNESNLMRRREGWLYSMIAYAPLEMYSDLSQPIIADHFARNTSDMVIALPVFTPSGDHVEDLNLLMANLQPFTQTARDEFVTGRRSFDEWDAYVAECEAMGSEEANGYVQEWLDAYYAGLE